MDENMDSNLKGGIKSENYRQKLNNNKYFHNPRFFHKRGIPLRFLAKSSNQILI